MLDLETAETLDRLARDWRVSKSEALRRAIRSAGSASAPDRVALFRRLQEVVKLDRAAATQWAAEVRAERRAGRGGAAAGGTARRRR